MKHEQSQLNEAIQFVAIGLAVQAVPGLIPYEALSEYEDVKSVIYWVLAFASFMFLIRGAIKARNA
jgi:hypothetical protein